MNGFAQILKSYGSCYLLNNIQRNLQEVGIPLGGPIDPEAFCEALKPLESETTSQVIEGYNATLLIRFSVETVVCIVGHANILINQKRSKASLILPVNAGDVIEVSSISSGGLFYIAVQRGWSCQFQKPLAKTGIALTKGAVLKYMSTNSIVQSIQSSCVKADSYIFKLERGPEADAFSPTQWNYLWNSHFFKSDLTNRHAVVLSKDPILEHDLQITSKITTSGMVQCTPSGSLIILSRDCQSVGGYPRIGYILPSLLSQFYYCSKVKAIKFIEHDYKK